MSTSSKVKSERPTVFVVRHGDTRFNTGDPSTDRAKGRMDLPLTEKGHAKAVADGAKLASHAIAAVHHSPLKRSAQSAQHIAKAVSAELVSHADLDPWDIGYLAGQLRREIADRIDYYIAHKNRTVPDGESYGDFWKRITAAFARIFKLAESAEDAALVIVGHSDGIEAVTSWLDGALPAAQQARTGVVPGAILIFEKTGGSWHWQEWSGTRTKEQDEE